MSNRPLTNDLHELVKSEVKSNMRPFCLASFVGEERTNRKQNHIIDLLNNLKPSSFWHVVDHVLTKIALFIGFVILLTKCGG